MTDPQPVSPHSSKRKLSAGQTLVLLAVALTLCGLVVLTSNSTNNSVPFRSFDHQSHHERVLQESTSCEDLVANSAFASYLTAIPTVGGLQACVAENIADLVSVVTGSDSACPLSSLSTLFSTDSTDEDVVAFTTILNALLAGLADATSSSTATSTTTDLASSLSSWSSDSATVSGFCNVMNTQGGPCVGALVPALIAMIEKGTKCCATLNSYIELAKLIVPTGKSLEQTVFDIVNGLHRTMCTTADKDTLCGQSLFGYLAEVVSSDATSLLTPMLINAGLPLYAASDVCTALETTSISNRVTPDTSIPYFAYSCCAAGLSALMESLDNVFTHLFGNSIPELLNLVTSKQKLATSEQFTAFYDDVNDCSFLKTCSDPEFLLPTSSGSLGASSKAVSAKTMEPENVTCTHVDICDTDDVCTSVCEEGTVVIEPWVARAITYQRNLSYAKSLCYTQLPGTHNSATTLARGYGNRDQLFNSVLNASNSNSYMRTNNQFLTITDQLNIGARFIEVDAHYFGGSLISGHCSNIDFSIIDEASASLIAELKTILSGGDNANNVVIEWQASLLGCLPSLSGIRAELQRLHNETVTEIATWLNDNPNDLIVLYTEIGDEISSFSKTETLLALYEAAFGDLAYTPANFKADGGAWDAFTLSDLIAKGKRIILVATPEANDWMFNMRDLCSGFDDVPGGTVTDSSGTFWGETMNAGTIVRAYSSELHYASMSEGELGGDIGDVDTVTQPDHVNVSTLPVFVNAGVNILAPDGLDGATMAAMVWTWAKNEPLDGSVAVQLSAADGKWYGVTDESTIGYVACVSSSDRSSWQVVVQGSSCPDGFTTGAPQLAIENVALLTVLYASGADATAQLEVDLSQIPSISEEDQNAFNGGVATSNTSSSTGDTTSNDAFNGNAAAINTWFVAMIITVWMAVKS